MSEIRDLYQQTILDHNKNPRNFGKPAGYNRQAEGYNPLCGDRVHIYVVWAEEKISGIGFEGSGCAISRASASLMTEASQNKTVDEIRDLFQRFESMLSSGITEDLGELNALSGVRQFPVRIQCAKLPWETLLQSFAKCCS